jgi:curli biogenesis system outer membrane secretion channel CsgG
LAVLSGCSSGGASAQSVTPTPNTTPAATTPDTRPGVAVFPFFNGGSYGDKKEDLALLSVGLQQMLMYELAANTNIRVVDRSTLKELLAEQDLGQSGRVSPETAARIGKVVGARYVVTGGFTDMFGEFQLNGRIVDVETTEVINSAQVTGKREKLYGLVVDMGKGVTTGVKLPALPAAQQDARKNRAITPEAIVRHAMILSLQDEGQTAKAIELYEQLTNEFPAMIEWKEELRQLKGT